MAIPPVGPLPPAAPAAQAPAPSRSFGEVLERRTAHPAAPEPSPGGPAVSALESIERAQRRLDAVLQAARSGRTFTAQELLGLQAQAYRYAQTVDLASKLVENGAQAVKQALNTQI
ncbi:MAG TPA: hypothetical protein VLS93_08535 [Anaeromyxobacteraceae bacterium]|nr:hypothetical protein [Anaeromyxobacteraceae bacterium]